MVIRAEPEIQTVSPDFSFARVNGLQPFIERELTLLSIFIELVSVSGRHFVDIIFALAS